MMTDLERAKFEIANLKDKLEKSERKAKAYTAIQRACGELPDAWTIRIDLENGAGTVSLVDPDNDDVEYPSNHEHMFESINDAVDAAIKFNKLGGA